MYEVNAADIRNEANPIEFLWKIMAWLDVKSRDRISESYFHHTAEHNIFVNSKQIEDALDMLVEEGLIERIPNNTIELTAGLDRIADFSNRTPLPNSRGN